MLVAKLIRYGSAAGFVTNGAAAVLAQASVDTSLDLVDFLQFGVIGLMFFLGMIGKIRWEREVTDRDTQIAELKSAGAEKDKVIETYRGKFETEVYSLLRDALEVIPPLLRQQRGR